MGISKTGISHSITKEDLNAAYHQGFADAVDIYEEKLDSIIKQLEELQNFIDNALDPRVTCYHIPSLHFAYKQTIKIVKEEKVINE